MPSCNYFQQHEGYFWQWEEEGEVVAIPGGNTIAYKAFIADVLEKITDPGLPPFGSLLLVLIATNSDNNVSLFAVRSLVEKAVANLKATQLDEPLNTALDFLTMVSALPLKYREGKNRMLLLHTLFNNCHNRLSYRKSKDIYNTFLQANKVMEEWMKPEQFYFNLYHEDFRVVSLLAKKFPDGESLMGALAALPLFEEELDLEEIEPVEPIEKDFIETLCDNTQTFHVGSLVKRLWSGLNIPYHNTLPSNQPMGGVSDLTNKGDFHRLLISEFANEDMVFLSRLANNEALYMNREAPPQNNNLERIILIDVSIKNWGTPKAIAYALLLAIARHPKTDIPCSAYAVGDSYQVLSFDTINNIIQSLQVLEPCLHPANGIALYFKEASNQKNKEVFFISSAETFRQPQLHRVISDHYTSFSYWLQTDDRGNIDVYKRQQTSKKHVQHVQLPLTDLWKREQKVEPEFEGLRKSNYPILFPSGNPKKVICSQPGNKTFIITAEKHLLQLSGHKSGWCLVYENLAFTGGDAKIGVLENGHYLLFIFHQHTRDINLINLMTGEKQTTNFTQWRSSVYKGFVFHCNKFYYAYLGFPSQCWTFELNNTIQIQMVENIPKEIMDKLKEKEKADNQSDIHPLDLKPIFKNIGSIFINEVNNLVFNIHELRLTDQQVIQIKKTGFLRKEIEATTVSKNSFQFSDGSTITVNRSGMLILKSSSPDIETIYVPSVLETSLGIATTTDFAGNDYYYFHIPEISRISSQNFWQQYMIPFIETIKNHGTYIKTSP